mgnify:CR=1 FL=1
MILVRERAGSPVLKTDGSPGVPHPGFIETIEAFDGEKLVAQVALHDGSEDPAQDAFAAFAPYVVLTRLWVAPEYRMRGLARTLGEIALERSVELRLTPVAGVRTAERGIMAFYLGAGFVAFASRPDPLGEVTLLRFRPTESAVRVVSTSPTLRP